VVTENPARATRREGGTDAVMIADIASHERRVVVAGAA